MQLQSTRPCLTCGLPITQSRNGLRRYCESCLQERDKQQRQEAMKRQAAKIRARHAATEPTNCLGCGVPMPPYQGSGRVPSWCKPCATRHYREHGSQHNAAIRRDQEANRERKARACQWCGKDYVPPLRIRRGPDGKYCSPICQRKGHQRDTYHGRVCQVETRYCLECGALFTAGGKGMRSQVVCSKACLALHDRAYNIAHVTKRDRQKRDTTDPNRPITITGIYERDGGRCQIEGCRNRKPIDMTLNYLDPLSFTFDHIVPLSQDGTHTWENVRAAHRFCNISRNNRRSGQLVLL